MLSAPEVLGFPSPSRNLPGLNVSGEGEGFVGSLVIVLAWTYIRDFISWYQLRGGLTRYLPIQRALLAGDTLGSYHLLSGDGEALPAVHLGTPF